MKVVRSGKILDRYKCQLTGASDAVNGEYEREKKLGMIRRIFDLRSQKINCPLFEMGRLQEKQAIHRPLGWKQVFWIW